MNKPSEKLLNVAEAIRVAHSMGVHTSWVDVARAAVVAMREPTDEMINVSGCECGLSTLSEEGSHEEYVKSDYRAMIYVVLKPEE